MKKKIKNNFWTNGNGNDFLKWAKVNSDQLKSNFNEELFLQYDFETDELVKTWSNDDSLEEIMSYLYAIKSTGNVPIGFKSFKENLSHIPSWVNLDLIECGEQFLQKTGFVGLLVLRNFALLGGYSFANLTKPLISTGSLKKSSVHRLYNTLRFWIEISRTTNGNSQDLRLNACLRTRIIHSLSRLMIEKKEPNWNYEKYGVPINHADMVATNIGFTLYFLYGLNKLNFKYTQKDEKGLFHLWKYTTYLLGAPEHIIPNNKEEALSFFYFWTYNQQPPDDNSIELAKSLINENTVISFFKPKIIKRNINNIHKTVANYLIENDTLNSLNIPRAKYKNVILSAIKIRNAFHANMDNRIFQGNKEQLSVLKDYEKRKTTQNNN